MSGRPNGNGNGSGGRRNGAQRQDVPRWVRTLFDEHERTHREHEERMAAHEEQMDAHRERMDKMDEDLKIYRNEELETRRQTREIIADIARLDAQRAKDGKALVDALRVVHGRVVRLETGRKG